MKRMQPPFLRRVFKEFPRGEVVEDGVTDTIEMAYSTENIEQGPGVVVDHHMHVETPRV